MAVSLETGHANVLTAGGFPKCVESGHLAYASSGALWVATFDPDTPALTGPSVPVLSGVGLTELGSAPFAVARSGSLVFATGAERTEAVWMSADGPTQPALPEAGPFVDPRLSPDGRRLAIARIDDGNQDVWWFDLGRETPDIVTTQPGADMAPIWDASGERLTYTEASANGFAVVQVSIGDAAGATERLFDLTDIGFPSSCSQDGRYLAYVQFALGTSDIWLYDRDGGNEPFAATAAGERDPEISPDGGRIAYTSDRSGRPEVYVASFPGGGGARPVSTGGGFHPVWSSTGERLFYRTETHVVVVDVQDGGGFGAPRPRSSRRPSSAGSCARTTWRRTASGSCCSAPRPGSGRSST